MASAQSGFEPTEGAPRVTVELFGMPRLVAGGREIVIAWHPNLTLSDLPARLVEACPLLAGRVLDAAGGLATGLAFNLNGRAFVRDPSTALRPGDRLLLLSADPGG
jgi:hypothetical protein